MGSIRPTARLTTSASPCHDPDGEGSRTSGRRPHDAVPGRGSSQACLQSPPWCGVKEQVDVVAMGVGDRGAEDDPLVVAGDGHAEEAAAALFEFGELADAGFGPLVAVASPRSSL